MNVGDPRRVLAWREISGELGVVLDVSVAQRTHHESLSKTGVPPRESGRELELGPGRLIVAEIEPHVHERHAGQRERHDHSSR